MLANLYCYYCCSITVQKVSLSLAFTADLPQPDRLKVLAEQAVARKKTELQASHSAVHIHLSSEDTSLEMSFATVQNHTIEASATLCHCILP